MVWLPFTVSLYASACDSWPQQPCPHRLYILNLSPHSADPDAESDADPDQHAAPLVEESVPPKPVPTLTMEMTLRALGLVKHRKEIYRLAFDLNQLFDWEFRKSVGELLDLNDRPWSIDFEERCAEGVIQGMAQEELQMSLSVLQKAKNISAFFSGKHSDTLHLLRNMPDFEQLECFDMLFHVDVDNKCLEELMDLPFAPLITGVCVDTGLDSLEQQQPIFSRNTSRHIGAYELDLLLGDSTSTTVALIEALSALPALRRLDVRLWDDDVIIDSEPLHILCEWLKSPRCDLTELRLHFHEDFSSAEPPLTFADLPTVPRLKGLVVTGCNTIESLNVEAMFQFLKDSPCLECVLLEACYLDKHAARRLLECQLHCRPRLLTIQLGHAMHVEDDYVDTENFHQIELLYECIRDFRQSSSQTALPLSAWPMLLKKLGNVVRSPTNTIHKVGIEAIYNVLPQLVGDPDWMHSTKRRRIV